MNGPGMRLQKLWQDSLCPSWECGEKWGVTAPHTPPWGSPLSKTMTPKMASGSERRVWESQPPRRPVAAALPLLEGQQVGMGPLHLPARGAGLWPPCAPRRVMLQPRSPGGLLHAG